LERKPSMAVHVYKMLTYTPSARTIGPFRAF
jgi:hypothetical protein